MPSQLTGNRERTSTTVHVRRATPDDQPAIFAFVRGAYAGRWQFKIPHRWRWEFLENPFLASPELPIWIAIDGRGRVVGQSCALVEPLKLGDRILKVGWGVDAYVDPAFRGCGIGRQLQQANRDAHDIFMSISMSPVVRRIKVDLGLTPIHPVITYLRPYPLDAGRAASALLSHITKEGSASQAGLAKLMRLSRLDGVAASAYNQRRVLQDSRAMAAADNRVVVTPVDRFDDEVDLLWEDVSPRFHALVKRDSVYLNWKYVRQPHMQYHKFLARRAGKLCGYLIARIGQPPEPNIGIVADIFVSPDDTGTIMALLSQAIRFFSRAGVTSVLASTTIPEYQHALGRFGFTKIQEEQPLVGSRNAGMDVNALVNNGPWLLGRGDHDWDQYPLGASY